MKTKEQEFDEILEQRKVEDVIPKANPFNDLNAINVNKHTEKKNGLTYLSWSWAWAEVCKRYDDVRYEVRDWNGVPYLYDQNLGYLVETSVSINGITHTMRLPVMDGANKAMKAEPYTYKVKEYYQGKATGNFIDKTVEAATMFDINTAIMRCLVKNLAMFGLGLYIYSGEDLPEGEKKLPLMNDNMFKGYLEALKSGKAKMTIERSKEVYSFTEEQLSKLNAL